jgi:hypothetical protein
LSYQTRKVSIKKQWTIQLIDDKRDLQRQVIELERASLKDTYIFTPDISNNIKMHHVNITSETYFPASGKTVKSS